MQLDYILDANRNRFKEGARVLEDIARFVLMHEGLFLRIKELKHQVKIETPFREPLHDLGGENYVEVKPERDLLQVINANALRMQEAARVLEEFDDRNFYKRLRYESYDVHAQLVRLLSFHSFLKSKPGLLLVCDVEQIPVNKIVEVVNTVAIPVLSICCKGWNSRRLLPAVREIATGIDRSETLLIIHSHVDVALALGDGVHLEQEDFPVREVRKLRPDNFVIGVSCNTTAEAVAAQQDGATYIAAGSPLDGLADHVSGSIFDQIDLPICCFGKDHSGDRDKLLHMGCSLMGVGLSVWDRKNPAQYLKELQAALTAKTTK